MKKILTLLMVTAAVASCSKDDQPAAPTLELSSKNAIEFTAAAPASEAVTITVTTNQPSWDAVSDQTWCIVTKSGNTFIVAANPNTLPTAPAPAVVTVSAGGAVPVKVAVTQKAFIAVTGVALNKTTLEVVTGEEETLIANITPANADNKDVVWSSSNPAVATVDQSGKVKTLKAGQATITASSSGQSADCALTVTLGIGGYYPDAVNPVGVIFRVKTATQKGLVLSLTESPDDVVWSNDALKTFAIDENDGSFNMIAAQQYLTDNSKSWSDLPPFNYIVTMNGQTTYDAVRDKWYLPSVNEWKEFAAVFSGKVYKDIAVWGIISPMLGYDDLSCVAARTAFNAKFTSKSGTQLDLSRDTGWYLSSTEHHSGDNVIYSFGLEAGSASADPKNLTGRVRAILAF